MYIFRSFEISSIEISGFLNKEATGNEVIVNVPSSIERVQDNSFICLTEKDASLIQNLNSAHDVLVITNMQLEPSENYSVLYSNNPKLDFLKVLNEFFVKSKKSVIAENATVHPSAKVGRNVSIGHHSVVGPDVIIGDNTTILNNVVITNQVTIGNNCIIKHNSVVGSEGFDFEVDKFGIPIHFPHLGRITIGNNVWIGSNTTIESGKLENTIINDDVKIDDLVHIGYNCQIGYRSMITAGVIIERYVTIGSDVLIASNATIGQKLTIGDKALIGEGSVVVKNAEEASTYIGNPAKILKK